MDQLTHKSGLGNTVNYECDDIDIFEKLKGIDFFKDFVEYQYVNVCMAGTRLKPRISDTIWQRHSRPMLKILTNFKPKKTKEILWSALNKQHL